MDAARQIAELLEIIGVNEHSELVIREHTLKVNGRDDQKISNFMCSTAWVVLINWRVDYKHPLSENVLISLPIDERHLLERVWFTKLYVPVL